jgi:hypothetical protein
LTFFTKGDWNLALYGVNDTHRTKIQVWESIFWHEKKKKDDKKLAYTASLPSLLTCADRAQLYQARQLVESKNNLPDTTKLSSVK